MQFLFLQMGYAVALDLAYCGAVTSDVNPSAPRVIGRYAVFHEIAAGGMATVHLGRLLGPVGFSRTVAIKKLHPHFAKDPEFVSMFLDEARLAARIQHPNVVSILDVVALEGELFLVMDYVHGESLSRLLRTSRDQASRPPIRVVISIMTGALYGLHAAHEARNERGDPLGIVHRDVSPQNIMVGVDGVARVFDFGVAKAVGRSQTTREGQLKGKLAYMAPEQLKRGQVDRRTDVYAASVVLWEALSGRRLFEGATEAEIYGTVLSGAFQAPSSVVPDIPKELDEAVMRGLEQEPGDRYGTAKEMAVALENALAPAIPREVGEWVEEEAKDTLSRRARQISQTESSEPGSAPPPSSGHSIVIRTSVGPRDTDAQRNDDILDMDTRPSIPLPSSATNSRIDLVRESAPSSPDTETVDIRSEADVVRARTHASAFCASLGFQESDQVKVATGVSELARNIIQYAGSGEIIFRIVRESRPNGPGRAGVEVVAQDRGPGNPHIERILKGDYTSKTGLGLGLIGTKRLMDAFDIETLPGVGTKVIIRKYRS